MLGDELFSVFEDEASSKTTGAGVKRKHTAIDGENK